MSHPEGLVRLTIPGRLPGLNEYIDANRRDKHAGAKMKREAEGRILLAVRRQLRGVRFARPVVMRYTWVEPDRRRDKDNIAFARKFVQDALVKAGVLTGDGWKQISGFTDGFLVDRKRPRVEVLLEEAGEKEKEDAG